MDRFEGLEQRPLTPAEAGAAVRLSAEAGWNQTADDWRLMLELGTGWGMWTAPGRLVASALVLPFGGRFAWISMVLVTAEYQRRGIATYFLGHCIRAVRSMDLVPGLDATEAGRRVYLPRGFRDIYRLQRLTANPPRMPAAGGRQAVEFRVRPIEERDLAALADYDRACFGADRAAILGHLYRRQPDRALVAVSGRRVVGFVLARDGRDALQIGPLVAQEEATALALARRALDDIDGPVYMDVAERHRGLLHWLREWGFAGQRPFIRMILGHGQPLDDPARVFAIAGPELG